MTVARLVGRVGSGSEVFRVVVSAVADSGRPGCSAEPGAGPGEVFGPGPLQFQSVTVCPEHLHLGAVRHNEALPLRGRAYVALLRGAFGGGQHGLPLRQSCRYRISSSVSAISAGYVERRDGAHLNLPRPAGHTWGPRWPPAVAPFARTRTHAAIGPLVDAVSSGWATHRRLPAPVNALGCLWLDLRATNWVVGPLDVLWLAVATCSRNRFSQHAGAIH